mmetsp:Transcript_3240/g.6673  ORF Transcript_3240/g.6673 Transcript_3240/m.6673 type:complete len:217 (+) Transcript_3240:664-1314(+)
MIDDELVDTQRNDLEFLSLILAQAFVYLSCAAFKGIKPTLNDTDLQQLLKLKRSIVSVLERVAPKLLASLELVIEREQKWVAWKEQQCPQFEKAPIDELPVEEFAKFTISQTNGEPSHSLMGTVKQEMDFDSCITRIITDMDPDEGVEEEYKAKHDNVFSWRALRMVSQRELRVFQQIYDGDVDKVADQLKPVKRVGCAIDEGPTKRQEISEHLIN